MDKYEVLENYLNNPTEENCIKCLKYCYGKNIDFKDEDLVRIFYISVRYLMNVKIGKLTEEDAKVLITYFSNKYIRRYGLNESVSATIMTTEEYDEKIYGLSDAVCVDSGNTQEIFYSPKVIEQLTSNDISSFLYGLSTIFHEVIHSLQNSLISSNKNYDYANLIEPKLSLYVMTLETIIRRVDKDFYKKNYRNIYKENHAQGLGMQEAIKTIEEYNPKLYEMYDIDKINELIDQYFKAMNDSLIVLGRKNSHVKSMDTAICLYIEHHPEVIDEFPLLSLSFNKNGLKKNIIELIEDRRSKIQLNNNVESMNRLYEIICNDKNFVASNLGGTKQ